MKSGMDAVIAKSSKRAPLFKRKLAEKLDTEYAPKKAPASEKSDKREKSAEPMAETAPKSLNAKLDDVLTRLAALEKHCGMDEAEGDD